MLHAGSGNHAQAFALLEQAVAERNAFVPDLGVDPAFRELRSDPRMRRLLQKTGLK